MKDQLQAIRAELPAANNGSFEARDKILTALDQVEAMVGEQKPVAYLTRDEDGGEAMLFFDKIEAATYCEEGVEPDALVLAFAAPVAQQPRTIPMSCRCFDDAAKRYCADKGKCSQVVAQVAQQPQAPTESVLIDGIAYDTPAPVAAELLRLHLELKQPQAEAVPPTHVLAEAERYRWLRDKSVPPHNFYLSVPEEFHGVRYQPHEVDAYIDAAIAAAKKEAGHE